MPCLEPGACRLPETPRHYPTWVARAWVITDLRSAAADTGPTCLTVPVTKPGKVAAVAVAVAVTGEAGEGDAEGRHPST